MKMSMKTRMKTRIRILPAVVFAIVAVFAACTGEANMPPATEAAGAVYETPTEPTGPISEAPSPAVTAVNLTIAMGQDVTPAHMLDPSRPMQTAYFTAAPDLFRSGEQTVEINGTDGLGSHFTVTAVLTVLPNETPPTIEGVRDIVVPGRSTLLLRQGVSAYDAFGNPLEFFVDSHGVDADTPGLYVIMYYTYDGCGNRTEVAATVTVTDVDIDWVYRQVDDILAGITTADDSQVTQARAVHTWMTRNMTYAAAIGLSGRYENVNQGLRHRSGNCFVYFYTAEMMLTRLGIPNRRIDRAGGDTNHRWHLINPDGLGWHHFDTSPHHLAVAGEIDTFMFTAGQAAAFTRLIEDRLGRGYYYAYDGDLHPDIAE